jgi:hypothetical protein
VVEKPGRHRKKFSKGLTCGRPCEICWVSETLAVAICGTSCWAASDRERQSRCPRATACEARVWACYSARRTQSRCACVCVHLNPRVRLALELAVAVRTSVLAACSIRTFQLQMLAPRLAVQPLKWLHFHRESGTVSNRERQRFHFGLRISAAVVRLTYRESLKYVGFPRKIEIANPSRSDGRGRICRRYRPRCRGACAVT